MTDMTEAEAVLVIAEFDGWQERDHTETALHFPGGYRKTTVKRWFRSPFSPFSLPHKTLPDYAHDRDALSEVAKNLSHSEGLRLVDNLAHMTLGEPRVATVCGFARSEVFFMLTCPARTLLLALAQTIKEGKV